MCDSQRVLSTSPQPIGVVADHGQEKGGGVDFAIFSRWASRVRLELFEHPEDPAPARVIDLDSARKRAGNPMLLGGDEFRRTQGGNTNAYCQDNAISSIDWNCLERRQEIHRFARGMIAFRRAHTILSKEQFYTDAEIHWLGAQGGLPNWAEPKEKRFACMISEDDQRALCLMFNAGADAVNFALPPAPPGARWHLSVDTSRQAPEDLSAAGEEPLGEDPQTYYIGPRGPNAILLGRRTEAK